MGKSTSTKRLDLTAISRDTLPTILFEEENTLTTPVDFRILSDKEAALQNTDMFIGSVTTETHEVLVDGKFVQLPYVPGLVKIADEVIDNSVDEAIRTEFEHANVIEVTIEDNKITVTDNGRGIPQDMIQTPEGESIPRPLAAWTRARAGSNFNADRKTGGKNGIGSALTNWFSDSFVGITCNGKDVVTVNCTNNADNVSYKTTKGKTKGTSVAFVPDFEQFDVRGLDSNFETVVRSRLNILAIAFPKVKFKMNGKTVDGKFSKFVSLFGPSVSDSSENHSLFLATSDVFRQVSYVNNIHTKQGGTHVNGIMTALTDELIPMIKRKHKIEITKAQIAERLILGVFLRSFVAPKYDSQTKERLSSSWAQIRDHMNVDYKSLAKKLLGSEDLIMPIIETALAKKEAADKAAATKAQKKAKGADVPKHVKANDIGRRKCTLFLAEGDSAIGPFAQFRDKDTQGGFPLKGKLLNVWDLPDHEVLKSKEVAEIISILGVGLRSTEKPAYDQIAIFTDADLDGRGSICPLVIGFFYKYWPHWFAEGRILIAKTPEYISTDGKQTVWSYDKEEFQNQNFKGSKWTHRHIKGLGTLTTDGKNSEYAQCLKNPVFEQVVIDDGAAACLQMLLGDDSQCRKNWLGYETIDGDDSDDE